MIHGLLNFLKPPGLTSHDAVNFARRTLGTKRVGHGGTLDPAAAGVLPLGIGEGARLLPWLPGEKEYIAELQFGYETDTLDAVGQVTATADAGAVTESALSAMLPAYRGAQQQVPPLYSAIKTNGVKGYERARAGEDVELPSRAVEVHALRLLSFDPEASRARVWVRSGAGFYVRSLVRDIGRQTGAFATMTFLVRTAACGFALDAAVAPEELSEVAAQPAAAPGFVNFEDALCHCAAREAHSDETLASYLAGGSGWRDEARELAQGDTLLLRADIRNAAGNQAALLYEESRAAFFWIP